MVLGITFKFLIHFELIFVSSVKIRAQFHSFTCEYSIFPAPFIEKMVFSPFSILGSLGEIS